MKKDQDIETVRRLSKIESKYRNTLKLNPLLEHPEIFMDESDKSSNTNTHEVQSMGGETFGPGSKKFSNGVSSNKSETNVYRHV